MSAQNERHAWHQFREAMARRQVEYDGQVPVVLLCVAVCHGGEACHGHEARGAVHIDFEGTLATLRPGGLGTDQVARLFERAAAELRSGRLRAS